MKLRIFREHWFYTPTSSTGNTEDTRSMTVAKILKLKDILKTDFSIKAISIHSLRLFDLHFQEVS